MEYLDHDVTSWCNIKEGNAEKDELLNSYLPAEEGISYERITAKF